MTPIEKNMIVVDEQGNKYEATYPKRAKGLVKNGRARFVDEHTICLLSPCPPNNETEDIKMSKMIENTNEVNTTAETSAPQYTVEYILSQVAEIQKQTAYLNDTIVKLSAMGDGDSGECGSPGNIQGQAKAQAYGDIVRCRETTNQQMLKLYEKMYDNLISNQISKMESLSSVIEYAKTLCYEDFDDQVWNNVMKSLMRELGVAEY